MKHKIFYRALVPEQTGLSLLPRHSIAETERERDRERHRERDRERETEREKHAD